jgi:hypothetical protein
MLTEAVCYLVDTADQLLPVAKRAAAALRTRATRLDMAWKPTFGLS